jgi:RNA polymerase sigma-70 factor (ECF subfamily)
MLRDSTSGQWYECREFLKKLVRMQAKNIPQDHWEDIVQDALIRVSRSLHTFRHQCSLKTWLFSIIKNSIIDFHRKLSHAEQYRVPSGNSSENSETEEDMADVKSHLSMEEAFIIRETLEKVTEALDEYIFTHSKPERNRKILSMVLFEGRSQIEVAQKLGCSAAVVSYIVRSVLRYIRENVRN